MTAPLDLIVEQDQGSDPRRTLHRWCLLCVPPAPAPARAFCGYTTTTRNTLPPKDAQRCVVCVDLDKFPCEGCGM